MSDRKPFTKVKVGSVTIPVYMRQRTVSGVVRVSYTVPDSRDGHRRLIERSALEDAQNVATEIATSMATGSRSTLVRRDELDVEIRKSLQALEPLGIDLYEASMTVVRALQKIGGNNPADILAACNDWADRNTSQPLQPKSVGEAVEEFMGTRKGLSERTVCNLRYALGQFANAFPDHQLKDVTPRLLLQFIESNKWSPKTRNEFLGKVGQVYREGALRGWVPSGYSAVQGITKAKLPPSKVPIFTPEECRQMFSALEEKAPELCAFMALWCFSGARKEEISRLDWDAVNRALVSNVLFLDASITKTKRSRTVPIEPALRAWLEAYRKASGPLVPARFLVGNKSLPHRLGEIPATVSKVTGIRWQPNGPRHSYGTYLFAVTKDAGKVVKAMGNSLTKFELHYWNKSHSVTDDEAQRWFQVLPRRTPPSASNE